MAERSPATRRGLRFVLGGVFAFLYLPIAVLVALSFNEGGMPTAWTGFSAKWYGALLSNGDILSAAGNTLIVGTVSTLVATVLGTLLALG
ncbi:MAG: ABC transporter permease, partial [Rhodobacteraceae bacterium]|nr:ABC transporter permease [Paracoccaceae bacterium]